MPVIVNDAAGFHNIFLKIKNATLSSMISKMNSVNIPNIRKFAFTIIFCACITTKAEAQEAYEIQVYSAPVMTKNATMFELHSNISPSGPKNETDFKNPLHETVEITTGITDNFELGFYFFTRIGDGTFKYIGSHIRPRITVPESWNWNVGASLSVEVGFVKDPYSNVKDWDYEIRPIIDKTVNKNYISLNPTFEGSFTTKEISFSPNVKYSFAMNPAYSLGFEYYGSLGKPFSWERNNLQTHQIYLVTDLFLNPKFEFNFGVGHGFTGSSDMWNIKLILGQRVNWKK